VVRDYVAFIRAENVKHHRNNKLTHLIRFFGTEMVLGKDAIRETSKRDRSEVPGFFKGRLFADVSAGAVQKMIDGLASGMKNKRNYRNTFHALFEFALKRNHYTAINFRYPNPMSALPTYHKRNGEIIYLNEGQIDEVLHILEQSPQIRLAAALMIHAGLRRSEALWLRCQDVSADLKFLSVVDKTDERRNVESSLKTGGRSVPILPPLRAILEPYLAVPGASWLCHSPEGYQWDGDNFGARHRKSLASAGLSHTCL